ncbi:hypothetical protein ABPG73_010763 [Tetrahymena malaccensis]
MTDIYKYEIIQIKGKCIVIRFKSAQQSGLACNKNAFWISMIFDFVQSNFQLRFEQNIQLQDTLLYIEVFNKKLKDMSFFNHWDYQQEEDANLFNDIVEDWELLDAIKIKDEVNQQFIASRDKYWDTEAIYKINFSKEEYINFLKVGEVAYGA